MVMRSAPLKLALGVYVMVLSATLTWATLPVISTEAVPDPTTVEPDPAAGVIVPCSADTVTLTTPTPASTSEIEIWLPLPLLSTRAVSSRAGCALGMLFAGASLAAATLIARVATLLTAADAVGDLELDRA